jgi:excisionase family DNA binding protein
VLVLPSIPVASQLDTAQSLAEVLNVSVAYIRKLTRTSAIPVIRIGRAVRYDRHAVLEALQSRQSSAGVR